MPHHPARRLWATLETLHDVTYFAEGVRPAGIALGEHGVEEVLALLRPSARAVAASGMLPDVNTTGVPYPS